MLMVIFTVVMIISLCGGGYAFGGDGSNQRFFHGSFFLLWLCVAILGWVIFGGGHIPR